MILYKLKHEPKTDFEIGYMGGWVTREELIKGKFHPPTVVFEEATKEEIEDTLKKLV